MIIIDIIENITHDELDRALEKWSKHASYHRWRGRTNLKLGAKVLKLLEIVGVVLDEQEKEFKYKIKCDFRKDKTKLREYLDKLEIVQNLDFREMTLREIIDFDLGKYFEKK